ncbi:unnamed protein product [Meloidogyne enterolobii]|uniref:Uncharacterized protein n=1 Tax=Meloidogyne enterolobii TaxID=390850 RepID=A0ACB0Y4H8_MELEN
MDSSSLNYYYSTSSTSSSPSSPNITATFNNNNDNFECLHYIIQSPDPTNSLLAIIIFGIIYINIFIFGLLGNLAIVLLTLRCSHLRSVQNIFILNLALSDVIVCLLSLPFTLVTNIFKEWLFGSAICHLLPMVQAVSVLVSTFSLSAIAIDRYWLVHRPHGHSLSPSQATIVACILWAFSLFISLPYAYYMGLEEYEGYCGQFCSEQWPNTQIRRGYALAVLALQFLLPFLTMSFCYASIFSRLRRRNNTKLKKLNERQIMLARQSNNFENGLIVEEKVDCLSRKTSFFCEENVGGKIRVNALNKQQRRTTTILATVVLFFGLAWLPQNVLTMIIEYDIHLLNWGNVNYLYLLSLISHCLAMTTNVANPILYAWLNPTFKELFMRTTIIPLIFRKRKENNLIQTSTKQLNTTSIRSSIQNNNNSLNEKRILVHLNNFKN